MLHICDEIDERSGVVWCSGHGLEISYKSSSHRPVCKVGQHSRFGRSTVRTSHFQTIPEPLLPDQADAGLFVLVKFSGIHHLL